MMVLRLLSQILINNGENICYDFKVDESTTKLKRELKPSYYRSNILYHCNCAFMHPKSWLFSAPMVKSNIPHAVSSSILFVRYRNWIQLKHKKVYSRSIEHFSWQSDFHFQMHFSYFDNYRNGIHRRKKIEFVCVYMKTLKRDQANFSNRIFYWSQGENNYFTAK